MNPKERAAALILIVLCGLAVMSAHPMLRLPLGPAPAMAAGNTAQASSTPTDNTTSANSLAPVPQRVVQVDLATLPKISQFRDINSSAAGFGKNACGLVAAAAAVGGERWQALGGRFAQAAGPADDPDAGIQPTPYVAALKQVLGDGNVTGVNQSSVEELVQRLEAGDIVIVDLQVNANTETPSTTDPNYAHFARVLGIDQSRQEVYVQNTLHGGAYWTVPLATFTAAWKHPETQSSLIPDPNSAENVSNWAVFLKNVPVG